ncbi:MAG TPA: hypothetical protein VNS58_18010 [Puia sp.]|nr:hypothetical protein [Puia sp.]
MKRLSIIALFALTLISTSFANKTANPDFKGLESFNKAFPQATEVVYKVTDKFTEVNFTWHNMQLQAFYDLDGNAIGTSRKIPIKDLPLSYLINIRNEYPGYLLREAIEFDHTDSGLSYYITVVNAQKAYVLEVGANGTISVFKKMKN